MLLGTFDAVHATVGNTPHTFELVDQIFAGPYDGSSRIDYIFDNHRFQTFTATQTDLAAIDVPVIQNDEPTRATVYASLWFAQFDESGSVTNIGRFAEAIPVLLPIESGSHTAHLEFAPPVQLTPGHTYGILLSGGSAKNVEWEHNFDSVIDLYPDGAAYRKQIQVGQDRLFPLGGDFGFATYYTDPAKGPNNAPDISNLSLDTADFSRLFCDADISDIDGDDILPLSYDWIVNGVDVEYHRSAIPKSNTGNSLINTGDEVHCILYATDGEDTNQQQSETIIVQNSPPRFSVQSRVNIIDDAPIVFCLPSPFYDSDGNGTVELVEVIWYVNGQQILEIPPILYPPYHTLDQSFFTTDDEVSCDVTATDGVVSVIESSDNVIIPPPPPPPNRPPIADVGGPYFAELGFEFTLDGSGSSDPDDNIVRYTWYIYVEEPFKSFLYLFDGGETPTITTAESLSYDLGTHVVYLRVTDSDGAVNNAITSITVSDTIAPEITTPSDFTTDQTDDSTPLDEFDYGTATAIDIGDASPVITNDAPTVFPVGATIITWTATDASGNSASADQIITIIPIEPRVLKQEAIEDLESINGESKHTQKEIDKAIKEIGKSLDAKLWIDDVTLDSKKGHKVFDSEKKAVKSLMKTLEDKKKKHVASDDAKPIIQGVIDSLVSIDRQLATDAFEEANTSDNQSDKKSKKELDKSEKELAKGDSEESKDKFDKAIDKYKKVWKHAQKAMKHQISDDDDDEEEEEDNEENEEDDD